MRAFSLFFSDLCILTNLGYAVMRQSDYAAMQLCNYSYLKLLVIFVDADLRFYRRLLKFFFDVFSATLLTPENHLSFCLAELVNMRLCKYPVICIAG